MKFKKFLAAAMSATMAFSLMVTPVLAADQESLAGGEGSVEGDTTYIETTKYKVTLPTIESLDFTLDPEGLVGYFGDNDSATEATKEALADYAGAIVSGGTTQAINKSSVPVKLTCTFSLENVGNAEFVTDKQASLVDAEGTKETANKILLEIVPVAADATEVEAVEDLTAEGVLAIAVSTEEDATNELVFALPEATYQFVKTADGYDYQQTDDDPTGIATFGVTGYVAKDADWSDLAEATDKLTLNCVYKFSPLTEAPTDAYDATTFVVTDASKLVEAVTGLTDGGTISTVTTDTTLSFDVAAPSDGATVTAAAVTFQGKAYSVVYAQNGSTITLSNANITALLGIAGTYPVKLTFSDGTVYNLNWVVTAAE